MKKTALHKNSWREILKSKARFFSILGIIFLGVAFFAGIKATGPDMKEAANRYFQKTNYHDAVVLSTLGLDNEDLKLLQERTNLQSFESFRQEDALVKDENSVVRLFGYDANQKLDNIQLKKGRLPEKNDEILLDYQQNRLGNYHLGETITFTNTNLKNETFKIVGFGNSPLYVEHMSRGNTNVGKGSLDYFAFISTQNFTGDYFEGLRLTFKNVPQDTYSSDYDEFIAVKKKELEDLFSHRPKKRLEAIQKEATDKLAEAKETLANGQKELANAKEQLAKGQQELEEGKEQLAASKKEALEKMDAAKSELQGNEEKLQAGKAQLETAKSQLATQEEQLKEKEAELQKGNENLKHQLEMWPNYEAQGHQAMKDLETMQSSMQKENQRLDELTQLPPTEENQKILTTYLTSFSQMLNQLAEKGHLNQMGNVQASLNQWLEDVSNQEKQQGFISNLTNLQAEITQTIAKTNEEILTGKAKLLAAQEEIAQGQEALKAGQEALNQGKVTLKEQEAELEKNQQALEEGKKALATQEETLNQTFAEKEAELQAGEAEYQENLKAFEKEEKEQGEKIQKGQQELAAQENKINQMKAPTYLFMTRKDQGGFSEFGENAQRITNIATVFPVIFFLIAALVSFTTMARMVEEKRGELGALKALGYKNNEIAHKFILYAGLSGIFGWLFGIIAGNLLFPKLIFDAYGSMYNLTGLKVNWYPLDIFIAFIVALVCTLGSALIALNMDLKITPAALLRPKAPKAGQRILLERIPFIWKKLSFTYKVTARNLFRYKARGAMTIVGIAGCMALMLTGFGLKDSVGDISQLQFNKLWHYQGIVTFNDDVTEKEQDEYQKKLTNFSDLKEQMPISVKVLEKESSEVTRQNVTIYTPKSPQEISKFVLFKNRVTNDRYSLTNDGAIVSEKFAKLFHLKKGSAFTLKDANQKKYSLKVAEIAENYAMHFVYLTPSYYQKVFEEEPVYNSEFLIFKEMNKQRETKVAEDLMALPGVLNVSFISDTSKMMDDAMESLTIVIWVLIISAALLAFIVLYNLTNINISERIRELISIFPNVSANSQPLKY